MLVNVEHQEKTPTLRSNIEIKSRHGNGDERSKAVRSIYFPLTGIVAGSVTIDWITGRVLEVFPLRPSAAMPMGFVRASLD